MFLTSLSRANIQELENTTNKINTTSNIESYLNVFVIDKKCVCLTSSQIYSIQQINVEFFSWTYLFFPAATKFLAMSLSEMKKKYNKDESLRNIQKEKLGDIASQML